MNEDAYEHAAIFSLIQVVILNQRTMKERQGEVWQRTETTKRPRRSVGRPRKVSAKWAKTTSLGPLLYTIGYTRDPKKYLT